MLQNSTSRSGTRASRGHWNLEQHEGCTGLAFPAPQPAKRRRTVKIAKADATDWHLQFNQGGFTVKEGQYYTVSFEAASDQPRRSALRRARLTIPGATWA